MGVTLPQRDRALLEVMADGRFHSGEALGAAIGVSRAAVWKHLSRLAALGLDIERVRGKGYRLPWPVTLLDEDRIRARVGTPATDIDVRLVTGSTNEDALALARGTARPKAIFAEVQTRGRGRQGRPWHGALGGSLAFSLVTEFAGGARLDGLSLTVGVAVAETLRERYGIPVGLKWPNDLQVRGRKLGGILIELAGDLDTRCRPVIGIGLNCAPVHALEDSIDQPWTSVASELGTMPDRNALAADLLASLLETIERFRRDGFRARHAQWRRYDVLEGRAVRITRGGTAVEGIARGVNGQGALLVEVDGQLQEFAGGEVTVRPAQTSDACIF